MRDVRGRASRGNRSGHGHMPFAAVAGRAPRLETRRPQGLPQFAGAGPGGQRGAGRRKLGKVAQQGQFPHPRIAFRREAVQEERVHADAQTGRQDLRIAKAQRQRDGAALEFQAMQSGQQDRPSCRQLSPQTGQGLGRITRQESRQVLAFKGMPFQRHHVQRGAALRIVAPCLPESQEVQSQSETRFADGECSASAPTLRQAIAPQEHVFRLSQRARRRMVDIAISGAVEPAIGVEFSLGGDQGGIGEGHGNGGGRRNRE
ncbi:hypothetical protein LMG3410_06331 [Achromobacter aegrifaciens]|nr:hypothetical protein LMG3410_06331 [Achromobacter aegrifaciens]